MNKLLILIINIFFATTVIFAQSTKRHKEFVCPPELRPRMDFWIGVFARYGKHHVVMHHRYYPQAIYSVLDMTQQGATLTPIQFDVFKKKKVAEETRAIASAIRRLATGAGPRNQFEQNIQAALQRVPGGSKKYSLALEKEMIRSQTGIKEKFAEAIQRSGRYMHVLEHVFVNESGLPVELTKLPFIESSFDYTAYSSVGAAGIWQFMPATGREFGMQVGKVVDERRDILIATKAAARYLSRAYNSLGNWPLAVTSYNHGIGGVRKKVTTAGTNNIVKLIEHTGEPYFGFASGNFWPELLAAVDVYQNYRTYFPGLVKDTPRHYVTHTLTSAMSAGFASRKLGLPVATLQEYNYALVPAVWTGKFNIPAGYKLKVPKTVSGNILALNSQEQTVESSSVYGGITYTVRKGDTLGRIAKRYSVSAAHIKDLNKLSSDIVRVGQRLLIKESSARYTNAGQATSSTTTPTSVEASQVDTYYIVKSGDSVSGIAQRHGLSVRELLVLNNLKSSIIRVGQRLNIKRPNHNRTVSVVNVPTKQTVIAKPAATTINYRVQRGDTLWSISKKLGVSVDRLKQTNNIRGNSIKAGQVLKVRN